MKFGFCQVANLLRKIQGFAEVMKLEGFLDFSVVLR